MKTIAEKAYEIDRLLDEIFEKIILAVDNKSISEVFENGWPSVNDWAVDSYDNSIELIMSHEHRLTRETADNILALGFELIYESYLEDNKSHCDTWTKTAHNIKTATPRSLDSDESVTIAMLKAKNKRDIKTILCEYEWGLHK